MYNYRGPAVVGSNLPGDPAPSRDRGEQVVSHVLQHVGEPVPNFDRIQELIRHAQPDSLHEIRADKASPRGGCY